MSTQNVFLIRVQKFMLSTHVALEICGLKVPFHSVLHLALPMLNSASNTASHELRLHSVMAISGCSPLDYKFGGTFAITSGDRDP